MKLKIEIDEIREVIAGYIAEVYPKAKDIVASDLIDKYTQTYDSREFIGFEIDFGKIDT